MAALSVCGVGETGDAPALMDTASFCKNFHPLFDEDWSIVSEVGTALFETSPVNTAERKTTGSQGSRRSKIHAFFKRAWKALKKPFLCCRQMKVDSPHPSDRELEPVPAPPGLQNTYDAGSFVPGVSNYKSNNETQGCKRSKINPIFWCRQILKPVLNSEPDPEPSGLQNTGDTEPSSVPEVTYCEPNSGSLTDLYLLEDELGCKKSSEVFKAVRKSDGKEVAIKLISKRSNDYYISIPGCSRPLFKEVAFMLLLRCPPVSPYVIEMFEWFDETDSISFVMEYPQPCVVLWEFVSRNGHLSEKVTRGLMRQLVLALQNCLDHSILHNDLHSGNILVNTRTLELKLIDFGRAYRVESKQCEHIVRSAALSFGSLLYFMLKGCPLMFTSSKQLEQELTMIPSLSPECCDLILKCLKYDPEWETIEEMLQHQWFKHK